MQKTEAKQKFKKADEQFRAGWFDDALLILNELDDAFPDNHHVMYPKARCLAELGHYNAAFQLCDDMIDRWNYRRAYGLKRRMLDRGIEPGQDESANVAPDSRPAIPSFSQEDDMPPALSEFHESGHRFSLPDDDSTPDERMLAGMFGHIDNEQSSNGNRNLIIGITAAIALVAGLFAVFALTAPDNSAPHTGETRSLFDAIGILEGIGLAFLVWAVNALVIYAILAWTKKFPYGRRTDDALDTAILGFLATMLLVVPIFIPFLVKQRYQLSWGQTSVYVASEVLAIASLAALTWLILA